MYHSSVSLLRKYPADGAGAHKLPGRDSEHIDCVQVHVYLKA